MHSIPSKFKYLLTATFMCTLAAAFFAYEYYLRVVPSVLGPELKTYFHLSEAGLGVLAAVYYMSYTPAQLLVGILVDKYGPRIVLTLACLACSLGSYLFTEPDLLTAKFGRFILGLGSAFAFVSVLKITANWLPKKYFALMVGVTTAIGLFGANISQLVLSFFLESTSWQRILHISALGGLGLSLLLWSFLKNKPMTPVCHESKVNTSQDIKKLLKNLKQLLLNKQLWLIALIGSCTYITLTGFAEMWGIAFIENYFATSRLFAAKACSFVFFGYGIGGPVWGIFSDALCSRRNILMTGSSMACFTFCLILFYPSPSKFTLLSLMFFSGFFSSVQILVFAMANEITSHESNATAMSLINTGVMISGFIAPPLVGLILDSIALRLPHIALQTSYQWTLTLIPMSLLIAALVAYFVKETHPKHPLRRSCEFSPC